MSSSVLLALLFSGAAVAFQHSSVDSIQGKYDSIPSIEYPKTLFNYEIDQFLKESKSMVTLAKEYPVDDFKTKNIEAVGVRLGFDELSRAGDAFKFEIGEDEITAVGTLALKNVTIKIDTLDVTQRDTHTNVTLHSDEIHINVSYTGTNISHPTEHHGKCDTLITVRFLGVIIAKPLYDANNASCVTHQTSPACDMTSDFNNQVLPIIKVKMSSERFLQDVANQCRTHHVDLCEYF